MLDAVAPELDVTRRRQVRDAALARLPRWYSPALHLASPTLIGVAVMAACAAAVDHPTWAQLLTVPVVFLAANATEWRLHRDLLHRRSRLMPVLYDRHTPVHHRVYVTADMAMHERRELALILFPPYAVLLLAVGLLPLAFGLDLLLDRNVAALFLATCMFYLVSYEWLHMSYHLPRESFIGRRGVVRWLSRHHATHHNPRLMQRWNMNVSLPLWDVVRRTRVRDVDAGLRREGHHAPR